MKDYEQHNICPRNRNEDSMKDYEQCNICPRKCSVNRSAGHKGYCGMTDRLTVAHASLHMWEEPCLSGTAGAGTIFFSGCNMGCIYCQNYAISGRKADIVGREITMEQLVELFFRLRDEGANNIDLVTPTHFLPTIREAIKKAKLQNINIPFVYNTSGYENVEYLKTLEGLIDIYLPDMKYKDEGLALGLSNAKDYYHICMSAIDEMVRQQPDIVFDEGGIMSKGVIVRHMILPQHTRDSMEILKSLYDRYGDRIYLSIMNQYTPVIEHKEHTELNRQLTKREYSKVIDYAIEIGIENGFIQEGGAVGESFIPLFNPEGLFLNK